ncbi:endonuclease [Rossellomorea aquimaris]|nr:endonuclease [Rossellomorea aquimaris]MCA1054451.1 endonuclease [Rossellomorea aquimaris]
MLKCRFLPFQLFILLAFLLTGCSDPNENSVDMVSKTVDDDFTGEVISVENAIALQDQSTATVTGYIVGQPVSESKVLIKDFTNDFALAIADTADESDVNHMLFVQIPPGFRQPFGLESNPNSYGKKLTVTGTLTGYFSRPGLKNAEEFSSDERSDPIEEPELPDSPELQGYYQLAEGKTGADLKDALHEIIDDHHELTYKAVWDALKKTDEDPDNPANVILLYTGRSQSKSLFGGNKDDWNREHVWAKSHGEFGTSPGPGTDLHHLRPTDVTVNSSRSNLDFDEGGTPHPEAPSTFYDKDSWEPRDSIKGDVARMLFYMDVRYEGGGDEPDLELNDRVENNKKPLHGKRSVLLKWNKEDPVDEIEKRRNEIIYEQYQGNRNPFIDHPEWAELIW